MLGEVYENNGTSTSEHRTANAENCQVDVAVAIISSRESPDVLARALLAGFDALAGSSALVDVVVNGNPELAELFAGRMRSKGIDVPVNVKVRCWSLACGDKAHAWNTYVHHLWPGARTTVFMDGYVQVAQDAIALLHKELSENALALGATGTPSVGASARNLERSMVTGGGLHGNLFALGLDAMRMIRNANFFVPLGLYRVDSIIGAALYKHCTPKSDTWDVSRIVVLPAVSWYFKPLRWWRAKDWLTHFKRMSRQQQGRLENLAFRNFFIKRRQSLDNLPFTALELVEEWIRRAPEEAASVLSRFSSTRLALERMRVRRDWSSASVPPALLYQDRGELTPKMD